MRKVRNSIQGLILTAFLTAGQIAVADTQAIATGQAAAANAQASPAAQAAVVDSQAAVAEAETMAPDVLLTWGDKKVTVQDFDAAMMKVRPNDRVEFRRQMKRITSMLDDVMLYRTLAAEARMLGIDKDPLLQKRIELLVEEALAKERVIAYRKALPMPDMNATAEEYYKLHPDEFKVQEQVRVGHVLIGNDKGRTDAESLERTQLVRSKLLEGSKLNEVAVAFTDDPSVKSNSGDLGYFGRGRMVKEFEEAAFSMKNVGDVSDVVKTQFGYHVLKLLGKVEASQRPYAEVKDKIIARLNSEFAERELGSYLSKIRADKSIKLNTKAIDALQTRTHSSEPEK